MAPQECDTLVERMASLATDFPAVDCLPGAYADGHFIDSDSGLPDDGSIVPKGRAGLVDPNQ